MYALLLYLLEVPNLQRTLVYTPATLQKGQFSPIIIKAKHMGYDVTSNQFDKIFDQLKKVFEKQKFAAGSGVEEIIKEALE